MSAAPDPQQVDVDTARERHERVQARAALLGIELRITASDRGRPLHVASMHALTRGFGSLADVERWLDSIGAPQ